MDHLHSSNLINVAINVGELVDQVTQCTICTMHQIRHFVVNLSLLPATKESHFKRQAKHGKGSRLLFPKQDPLRALLVPMHLALHNTHVQGKDTVQCAHIVNFPCNRTRWDMTSHFTIVISFNIFLSDPGRPGVR